jgi:hypothetical protein
MCDHDITKIMCKKIEVEAAIKKSFDQYIKQDDMSLGVLWRLIGDNLEEDVELYHIIKEFKSEKV